MLAKDTLSKTIYNSPSQYISKKIPSPLAANHNLWQTVYSKDPGVFENRTVWRIKHDFSLGMSVIVPVAFIQLSAQKQFDIGRKDGNLIIAFKPIVVNFEELDELLEWS